MNKAVKALMKRYGVHSLGQPSKADTKEAPKKRFIKPVLVHDEDEQFLKQNRVRVT